MTDLTDLEQHVLKVLRDTPEYKDYYRTLRELQRDPRLYQRVNEMREKNFLIQQKDEEDIMELMDALTNEYEDVIGMSIVTEFIEAEAAFVKMIQDFTNTVTYGLEFD
ncbi:MAG: YlbF family regulator [Lachnospiraceae bacterium]|nr:YlbF family regulator [Lachnospiraceae bacterium]